MSLVPNETQSRKRAERRDARPRDTHVLIKKNCSHDLERDTHGRCGTQATYHGGWHHRTRIIVLAGFVGSLGVCTLLVTSFKVRASESAPFGPSIGAQESTQTLPILVAARNTDPAFARGGGSVTVVDHVALSADTSPFDHLSERNKPANPDQISWYSVQEGNTLSEIASMFGVSVNTIVWANGLKSGTDIRPGQTLLILPISGVQHTVRDGDTVASIAKRYGGDAQEILAYNNLPENEPLEVGAHITVPGGAIEEEKPKAKPSRTKGTVTSSGPSISGYYIHPIPGAVRTQGIHGYNAVDYGAPVGTPIVASAAGTVIVSRAGGMWNGGYGNYVVIDHPNGTQTLYAHNSSNEVWQGQSVVAGQIIGYVGNTGRSTGPHLHFEVRGAKNPF